MSSIIGFNDEGSEVCSTRSKAYPGKWFVSIRGPEPLRRWYHTPTIYTRAEAQMVQSFLFSLSDKVLEGIVDEKLAKVLEPSR